MIWSKKKLMILKKKYEDLKSHYELIKLDNRALRFLLKKREEINNE